MKNRQHQHKGKKHTQKNLRTLGLLLKVQLQIEYIPVELRPHVYVPEEPAECHAQEAAGCYQDGGESWQLLARGLYT